MLRNYLAAALRNLTRNGLYATVTIAGLAIGFAAAILIGLYVRDELSYDRFIPGHERTFLVNETIAGFGATVDTDTTPEEVGELLKLDFPDVQYVARATGGFPPALRHGDVIISEQSFIWADPDYFKVLPLTALAGDAAHGLEAPDGLVLTRTAARKYFGRDAPVGETLLVDGHPMRVNAVIADLPSNTSLSGQVFGAALAPFSAIKQFAGGGMVANIAVTYVRLKPGASAARVSAGLPRFVEQRVMPDVRRYSTHGHITMRLKPLADVHLHPAGQGDAKPGADPTVVAAIGVVGILIVVVAAINFVTLMTARASRRALEVGVRKALGAERRDLVVQFMGEAFVYVAAALVLGVAMAEIALPGVNAALQRTMTFSYLSDPGLFAALVGSAALAALAAGVYPALVLSAYRPSAVLKGGPAEGAGGGRVRQLLVVAQFSVLIALLICTVTIVRQTLFALKDATHVNQDQVLLVFASPCTEALRDGVAALPGVRRAACASPYAVALANNRDHMGSRGRDYDISTAAIDFGFFEVYGVKPIAGRFFDIARPADDGAQHKEGAPPVVINAAALRTLGYKRPADALGQSLDWHFTPEYFAGLKGDPNRPRRTSTIVGVAPDFTFGSVREPILPTLYFIGNRTSPMSSVVLNVKLDGSRIPETLPAIDKVFKRVTVGQPVQKVFADQFMLRLYISTLIQGAFIAVCALIAVSIACLGLFALSAYTAERRTKEIGIRKAMGASRGDILALLLWQFARPVLIANLIAWPAAFLVMRWWLAGFAYRVGLAPWTFLAAGGAAVLIALATVIAHGLRVAAAKPATALRYE